jgi:hypothetical protein
VTIALCVGGPMAPVASAQSSNAPVLDSQRPDGGPMPAPVGHRQPRESDLPPSVARDERDPGASRDQKATAAAQRAFDRSLDICRGC